MKLPKISFSQIGEKLQIAVKRFPLTVMAIFAYTVFIFVQIHSRENNYIDQRVWVFLPLAILALLAFYLFAENRIGCILKNALNVFIIGILGLFSFTLSTPIIDAELYRVVILGVSFALAIFFAPYVTGKNQLKFWDYLQDTFFQLVMAFFFGAVFMAGLSLALVSLDQLFGMNIPDRYYGYLATMCFVLFSPLYFLSSISKENRNEDVLQIDIPQFLKILGLYILLPILGIYLVILYGYLGKIIATWQLPNGWVSWLVSVLGIIGYLTIFILHPLYLKKENKVVNFFTRFFPLLLLPLLILMFIGIMRRFSDYGITINRLLVLILNLWLFGISIYLFIIKTKHTKWIFITFAAVAFLSAIGPWSVMKITKNTLTSELNQLLSEANWSVTQKNNTTKLKTPLLKPKKQERLKDIVNYLSTSYGYDLLRPYYEKTLGNKSTVYDFLKALGINKEFRDEEYFSYYSQNKNTALDIKGYNQLVRLSRISSKNDYEINDTLSAEIIENKLIISNKMNKQNLEVLLESIIQKSIEKERNLTENEDFVITGTEYKLIVYTIEGKNDKDNHLKINNLEAILLLK